MLCEKCRQKEIPKNYSNQLYEGGEILLVCDDCYYSRNKIVGELLTSGEKRNIDKAVKRATKQYKEVFKRLGEE